MNKISWEIPPKYQLPRFGLIFKSVSAVQTVFDTLKNIDFQGGIPTFSKTRQCFLKGIPQDIFFVHRAYGCAHFFRTLAISDDYSVH